MIEAVTVWLLLWEGARPGLQPNVARAATQCGPGCSPKHHTRDPGVLPRQALGAVANAPLMAAAARERELRGAQQPAARTTALMELAGGRRRLAGLPEALPDAAQACNRM